MVRAAPLQRTVSIADIARQVVELVGSRSITGHTLVIDAGISLA